MTTTPAPDWPTAYQSLRTLNGILALDRDTAYGVADVLGVSAEFLRTSPDANDVALATAAVLEDVIRLIRTGHGELDTMEGI